MDTVYLIERYAYSYREGTSQTDFLGVVGTVEEAAVAVLLHSKSTLKSSQVTTSIQTDLAIGVRAYPVTVGKVAAPAVVGFIVRTPHVPEVQFVHFDGETGEEFYPCGDTPVDLPSEDVVLAAIADPEGVQEYEGISYDNDHEEGEKIRVFFSRSLPAALTAAGAVQE